MWRQHRQNATHRAIPSHPRAAPATVGCVIYSWSYHHDAATRQRLRRLKRDLTALCLWHVFQMGHMGTRSLESGLYHSTMIWRFLPWRARAVPQTPHDAANPLWSEFSALITGIAARYATRDEAAPFVKEAMEALESWYLAEEAAEDRELDGGGHRAMLDPHRTLRWFGCFRYTVGKAADPPYWPERRDDVAEIHIQNHVTPDSPFSDRRRLAAWMQELAADVEANAPHVTRIGTGSWLNASRHFLQVYPPGYAASLVRMSGERKSGLGTWGQFITRDLRLNAPRAQLLRAEQTFACPQAYGNCSFDDFRRHTETAARQAGL